MAYTTKGRPKSTNIEDRRPFVMMPTPRGPMSMQPRASLNLNQPLNGRNKISKTTKGYRGGGF